MCIKTTGTGTGVFTVKKKFLVMMLMMCLFGTMGCKQETKTFSKVNENEEVKLMVATDPHYLSTSLYNEGSTFAQLLTTNDGKLIEYGDQILDQFARKVKEEKPDAVLLCGDLAFNGEKVSLEYVKQILEKIEEENNIPVLVIPGNHDINYPYAMSYIDDKADHVENVSQADFKNIMSEFGYDNAVSRDDSSFSYMYAISDNLYVLALDANTEDHPGELSDKTLAWMEDALTQADKAGARVISMSHQNVLKQSDFLYKGFVMNNYEKVDQILEKHHVLLNLSGHSHLQHESSENGLTDICTESMSVYPLRYSTVTIPASRDSFTYDMKDLGILKDKAEERFNETVYRMTSDDLSSLNISDEVRNEMASFATECNKAYFSGDTSKIESLKNERGWMLWQTYGTDTFWYVYMKSFLEDPS